jgi:motility quorum-sensing regulator/GCU-specific mRNA interferase toxin
MITAAADEGARLLGFEEAESVAAVLELTPACFYKSMEAEKQLGLWQDVYHLQYRSVDLYIKLQVSPRGLGVVVQFKKR